MAAPRAEYVAQMIISRRRLVAPTAPIVSLATMREHLRLDVTGSPPTHPDDTLVEAYVQAATDELDAGPTGDGWLGRALMPQQWRVIYNGFPCDDGNLILPYPPIISVDSVTYTQGSDAPVTMVAGTDYVAEIYGDPHGYLYTPYGVAWPGAERVTVTFTCGYQTGSPAVADVPELIQQFIRLRAASYYAQREMEAINVNVLPIDAFYNAVRTFRVWGP